MAIDYTNDPHFVWGHKKADLVNTKPASLLYEKTAPSSGAEMVLPAGILFCREGTQGFWIRIRFEYPAEHPRTHSGTQCLNTVRLPVKSTPLNLKPFLDQKNNSSSFPICLDYGLLLINLISVTMTYYDYPFDVWIHIIWIYPLVNKHRPWQIGVGRLVSTNKW